MKYSNESKLIVFLIIIAGILILMLAKQADNETFNGEITETAASTTADTSYLNHTVLPGQSLWDIANIYYGDGEYFLKIITENSQLIRDENIIEPGWVLVIPY